MENFGEKAAGATELRVQLEKGDIVVCAREGGPWALEWDSDAKDIPDVERDGDVLRVRQRAWGLLKQRLDVRLTMPAGVGAVELRTGWGRIEAEGCKGRMSLSTGNGALTLRAAGGEAEIATGNGEVSVEGYGGNITASTGNGRTRIDRLNGRASLKTGNGMVEVSHSVGRVRAVTGNGDVVLTAVGGEAEMSTGHGEVNVLSPQSLAVRATTAMGSINIQDGSVRALHVNSMMGEVSCTADLQPGKYELSTGMGAIRLQIPSTVRARIDAQTSFGQVDSDFPLVRVGRSGPMGFGGVRMVGSVGEGAPEFDISLRSGKGGLQLRRGPAQPRVTAAPAPPRVETPPPPVAQAVEPPAAPVEPVNRGTVETAQPPAADGTLAILEAVATGAITPEEADRLLSAGA